MEIKNRRINLSAGGEAHSGTLSVLCCFIYRAGWLKQNVFDEVFNHLQKDPEANEHEATFSELLEVTQRVVYGVRSHRLSRLDVETAELFDALSTQGRDGSYLNASP
jgi:hypothetical protein